MTGGGRARKFAPRWLRAATLVAAHAPALRAPADGKLDVEFKDVTFGYGGGSENGRASKAFPGILLEVAAVDAHFYHEVALERHRCEGLAIRLSSGGRARVGVFALAMAPTGARVVIASVRGAILFGHHPGLESVLFSAPAPIVCVIDALALVLHETSALLLAHLPGHGVVARRVAGLDACLARGHVTEPMFVI